MGAFSPPALLPRRALRGISMLYNWHQLIASYPDRLRALGWWGKAACWWVSPNGLRPACPCPLGSENPFYLWPPPLPRADPGLAAARGTEGLLVCACCTPTSSPASAWDPSQGLLWLPGPGALCCHGTAGDEALGVGCEAGQPRDGRGLELWSYRERPRPPVNSGKECWGPAGAGLDPSTEGLWQSWPHTLHDYWVLQLRGPWNRPQGRPGPHRHCPCAPGCPRGGLLSCTSGLTLRLCGEVAERF